MAGNLRKAMLSEQDYVFSMRLSPRGNRVTEPLRSLLIHRLRNAFKAVLRISIIKTLNGDDLFGLYCEACDKWFYDQKVSLEKVCPVCNRIFVPEFILYTEKD